MILQQPWEYLSNTNLILSPGLKKKISFKDLSQSEKIKRLGGMNDEAMAVYRGVYAMKINKLDATEKLFASTGILSAPLLEKLTDRRMGKMDASAKNEMLKILRKAGIKDKSLDPDKIKTELSKKVTVHGF